MTFSRYETFATTSRNCAFNCLKQRIKKNVNFNENFLYTKTKILILDFFLFQYNWREFLEGGSQLTGFCSRWHKSSLHCFMSEKLASTSIVPMGVLKSTNLNIFNMDFKMHEFLSPILEPSKTLVCV